MPGGRMAPPLWASQSGAASALAWIADSKSTSGRWRLASIRIDGVSHLQSERALGPLRSQVADTHHIGSGTEPPASTSRSVGEVTAYSASSRTSSLPSQCFIAKCASGTAGGSVRQSGHMPNRRSTENACGWCERSSRTVVVGRMGDILMGNSDSGSQNQRGVYQIRHIETTLGGRICPGVGGSTYLAMTMGVNQCYGCRYFLVAEL